MIKLSPKGALIQINKDATVQLSDHLFPHLESLLAAKCCFEEAEMASHLQSI